MKVLLAAIYTKFTAVNGGGIHNSFYTDVTGRLYFSFASQESTFPYAVYYQITSNPEWTFTDTFEDITIQFSLYSDQSSAVQIGDMRDHCIALFDWCTLSVSGYEFIYMRRDYDRIDWIPEEEVWQCIIQYSTYLRKT